MESIAKAIITVNSIVVITTSEIILRGRTRETQNMRIAAEVRRLLAKELIANREPDTIYIKVLQNNSVIRQWKYGYDSDKKSLYLK